MARHIPAHFKAAGTDRRPQPETNVSRAAVPAPAHDPHRALQNFSPHAAPPAMQNPNDSAALNRQKYRQTIRGKNPQRLADLRGKKSICLRKFVRTGERLNDINAQAVHLLRSGYGQRPVFLFKEPP